MSAPPPAAVQRLQVRFTRGEEVKYLSHLDLMRLWERALRRAELPVHLSQGFNPHPQIAIAAPLAVGVRSSGELMDVFMARRVHPSRFKSAINRSLPSGVEVIEALDVPIRWPSLTSRVRFADYRVTVDAAVAPEEVAGRIRALLSAASLPRERKRDKQTKRYDLRPLVDGLSLAAADGQRITLDMRLRTDETGSGRPDEVLLALGLEPVGMSALRTGLVLASSIT